MKVLSPELTNNSLIIEAFKREAQTLSHLAHPNIVPFYGIHKDGNVTFILQAFIEGINLREFLQSHKVLDIDLALRYMGQLCSALGFAHKKGIIHGDLKPSNVLLDSNGKVFLSDFGLAQDTLNELTLIPTIKGGTPAYMAPEQIRGESVTPATDIYALGLILFEMLTGEHPFQSIWVSSLGDAAPKSEQIRYAHLNLEPNNPQKIRPELTEQLSEIILRSLDKEPALRYQNVQEFIYLLSRQTITQQEPPHRMLTRISSREQVSASTIPIVDSKKENGPPGFMQWIERILKTKPFFKRGLDVEKNAFQHATALLDQYEFIIPLVSANINFDYVFIDRNKELNLLLSGLTTTQQGVFLVSGHRGAGKTTFVTKALDKLTDRLKPNAELLVHVLINLSFLHSDLEIMHAILQGLKDRLLKLRINKYLDENIKADLENALIRIDNDIQQERVTDKNLSVNAGIPPTPSLGMNVGRSERFVERKIPNEYNSTKAKHDLISILKELRGCQVNYGQSKVKLRVVFVIDELDKVEDIESINLMLNSLKPIFTSAGTYFILIVSADQYISWTSRRKTGNVYDSLRSGLDLYVNCIWDTGKILSSIADPKKYLSKFDQILDCEEVFQHFLNYLSIRTRGNLDQLWHNSIMQYIVEQEGWKFLVFTREQIREIRFYSGIYALVTSVLEDQLEDEEDQRDRDIIKAAIYEITVRVINSSKHGVTKEEINQFVKMPSQTLANTMTRLIEILTKEMVLGEYFEQKGQVYHLNKRRLIEKGSIVSFSNHEVHNSLISPKSEQNLDANENESSITSTEFKSPPNFLTPATTIHAILKAAGNVISIVIAEDDPIRFSCETESFFEKFDMGRGSDNDLQIHDKKLSRYHARVVFSEDGWYIYDMNTANGTLVNHVPTTQTLLNNGDVVFLGDTVIKFEVEESELQ